MVIFFKLPSEGKEVCWMISYEKWEEFFSFPQNLVSVVPTWKCVYNGYAVVKWSLNEATARSPFYIYHKRVWILTNSKIILAFVFSWIA
jgi:hypothetical protein